MTMTDGSIETIHCSQSQSYIGTVHTYTCIDISHLHGWSCSDSNGTLFSIVEAVKDAELKKAFTTSKYYDDCCDYGINEDHGQGIKEDIKQLCGSLLNLLEGAAEEPKQKTTAEVIPQAEGVSPPDKVNFVERCFHFYDRLLNFKYAGNCIVANTVRVVFTNYSDSSYRLFCCLLKIWLVHTSFQHP